jgi:hypothetical protein
MASSSSQQQQQQRRPARRANKNLMSRQYYTSSFSGVDWGNFLNGSMRSGGGARHRESDFSVGTDSIDFPSLGSANSSGSVKESKARSGRGNKKTTNAAAVAALRDDSMEEESVGSKMLVEQILQEEEQMARPSFLKGLKDLCAPVAKNDRKQSSGRSNGRELVLI